MDALVGRYRVLSKKMKLSAMRCTYHDAALDLIGERRSFDGGKEHWPPRAGLQVPQQCHRRRVSAYFSFASSSEAQ